MTKEKYTFLLPAYKGFFLKDALKSIQAQTLEAFQCIVSDDCSPEDIRGIFDSVVGNDSRFTYRRNTENLGRKDLVAHWNLLVDLCDTEFFIMASDDDMYAPTYLEKIDNLTAKYPSINLYRARIQEIDESNTKRRSEALFPEYVDWVRFFRIVYLRESLFCEAAYCYRTKPFIKYGRYVNTPLAWYTDNATHIQMAEEGCAITNEVLFYFRLSNMSISGTSTGSVALQKVQASFIFWEWIKNITMKMPDDEIHLKEIALYECEQDIITNINNYLIRCHTIDFFKHLKKAQSEFNLSRAILIYKWMNFKIYNLRHSLK